MRGVRRHRGIALVGALTGTALIAFGIAGAALIGNEHDHDHGPQIPPPGNVRVEPDWQDHNPGRFDQDEH